MDIDADLKMYIVSFKKLIVAGNKETPLFSEVYHITSGYKLEEFE